MLWILDSSAKPKKLFCLGADHSLTTLNPAYLCCTLSLDGSASLFATCTIMAWQHRNRPANQTEPPALPTLPHPLLLPPTLDSSAARLLSSLLFDSSLMTARPSLLPITESAIHSMAAIPARPNPRVAAGCADGSIYVCCGETGSRVWAAPGAHKGEVQSLVWLFWPDGPLAEERGDDDSDTATDEQKVMLNEDEAPVTPGDDDWEEKAEVVSSPGPRCSSSAGWLASSGPDNVARVWGAEGGAPLHSLWMPKADAGHSRSYPLPLQRPCRLCPLLFLHPLLLFLPAQPLHPPPPPPSLSRIVRPPLLPSSPALSFSAPSLIPVLPPGLPPLPCLALPIQGSVLRSLFIPLLFTKLNQSASTATPPETTTPCLRLSLLVPPQAVRAKARSLWLWSGRASARTSAARGCSPPQQEGLSSSGRSRRHPHSKQ